MLSGLKTLAVYHGAAFRIYEVGWFSVAERFNVTFVVVKMSNRDSTTRCGFIALTQLHVNSINAKVAII